jgi:hypothetical protein
MQFISILRAGSQVGDTPDHCIPHGHTVGPRPYQVIQLNAMMIEAYRHGLQWLDVFRRPGGEVNTLAAAQIFLLWTL